MQTSSWEQSQPIKTPVTEESLRVSELATKSTFSNEMHKGQELGWPWMIHPAATAEFQQKHWETSPLLLTRGSRYNDRLRLGLEDIPELLARQAAAEGDPELMHPNGRSSQANCEWVMHGMKDRHGEFPSVFAAYLAGATIVCHMVQSYYTPIAGLMRGLQEHRGFGWTGNMYLSPRESRGFDTHTDNTDGFIIQLAGAKTWRLYNTTFPRPLRRQQAGRPWEGPVAEVQGPLLFRDTLRPGSLLHVPRGFPHAAAAGALTPC